MPLRSQSYHVRVRGPYACFTRPELKTERVSYEVMTPSAARGVLEAILWKPAIRWVIERLHVLAPIRFSAVRRNEVNSKLAIRGDVANYFADEDRAQRNTILLTDVDYVIDAHFVMTDRAGPDDKMQKFEEMFSRRLEKGQSFHAPYLGCREFAARFETAPEQWEIPKELQERRELGLMLLDLDFAPDRSGRATPRFFAAVIENGAIDVPEVHR
ncbi:MAG TPA: type I-C CRISPR-associated protein Cas5c [Thermoanaerobaculia bacterium]|nr:type I-C CRISPR-associated protein Cas5c [Thermoanaerobaculia bacterium]